MSQFGAGLEYLTLTMERYIDVSQFGAGLEYLTLTMER